MQDFDKLINIVDSDLIKEGVELPKIYLHKWLVLGQTEYLCKYGTLSDGHEKITSAQRYAQALKELYYLCHNVALQKATALEAKADLADAEEDYKNAEKESTKLRAQARAIKANGVLSSALVTVEDQMRMIKVYSDTVAELRPEVEAKYPGGIEQAELDNWVAVAKYRNMKEKTPGLSRETMSNLPLPPTVKAELGIAFDRPDMIAPLMVDKEDEIRKLETPSINTYLELKGAN